MVIVSAMGRAKARFRMKVVFVLIMAVLARHSLAYPGFDCGQGSAHLLLTDHIHCHPELKLACFEQLYLSVHKCTIKIWPHIRLDNKDCKRIRIVANVTDINQAVGQMAGPVEPAGSHADRHVELDFRRPDELLHIGFGTCQLMFDVVAVDNSSLPDPDEGLRPHTGLPSGLVLPLMLLPVMCLLALFVAGAITQLHLGPAQTAATGKQLRGGPGSPGLSAHHQQRVGDSPGLMLRLGAGSLMGRKRGFKRQRRGKGLSRPHYIGHPEQSVTNLLRYAAGSISNSAHKVAPLFRFPPSAVPPCLPSILEVAHEGHGMRAESPELGSQQQQQQYMMEEGLSCPSRLGSAVPGAGGAAVAAWWEAVAEAPAVLPRAQGEGQLAELEGEGAEQQQKSAGHGWLSWPWSGPRCKHLEEQQQPLL